MMEEYLIQNGQIVNFKKSAHIFRQGDDDHSLYFIKEGFLKAYYITSEGKEFVKSFITAGHMITSLTAAYGGAKCSFNLLCMEDVSLIKIDFKSMMDFSLSNPETLKMMVETLITLAQKKERREYELLCLSAEERYHLLWQENPEIFKKITQNDIAKYLGITPVALSRIKKRSPLPS